MLLVDLGMLLLLQSNLSECYKDSSLSFKLVMLLAKNHPFLYLPYIVMVRYKFGVFFKVHAYQIVNDHFIHNKDTLFRMVITGTAGTGKSFLMACLSS